VKHSLLSLFCFSTLCVFFPGCGEARKGDLPEDRFRQDEQLAQGRIVFMHNCNQCHVQGGPGLGPGLIDKPLPKTAIKTQVRIGAGTMPHFGKEKISDAELDAVVAYIKVVRKEGTPLAMR
jgi:mono/diheme cytochrome c family protein